MALTVGEANAVNTLLNHVLNLPSPTGKPPRTTQAQAAAQLLADKARKAIGAGLTGDEVLAAWPEPIRVCVVCGCTDEWSCDGGCAWIDVDAPGDEMVCTACVHEVEDAGDVGRQVDTVPDPARVLS